MYTYTASGLRESKTTNGETKKFIWDGGNMVLELEPNMRYTHFYVYGPDGLAYRRDSDGSVYSYNISYRGDVLSIMDEDLNRKLECVYDAYGNLLKEYSNNGFTDYFGYRGQYHDPESGYIYLRNRYLDPATGSFTSEDPIRDGLNWFNYCNGNPIKFADPWGTIREPGYNKYGQWSENPDADDFGQNSAKYQLLVSLGNSYGNAYSNEDRARIHQLANILRITDTTFRGVILCNNSRGAKGFGHNAVVLVNTFDEGLFFSYYNRNGEAWDDGELRFAILSPTQMGELKNRNGTVNEAVTIYGDRRWENGDASYDRFVWNSITSEQGEQMFWEAVNIFTSPGKYSLTGNQCDNVANQILSAGNNGYGIIAWPNTSHDNYKINKTYWINENGVNRGEKK